MLRNSEEGYAQSITISGDALVVGAPAEGSGVVYVYSLSAGWLREARLVPSDAAVGDRFGSSLKLSGDYLVVVASGHDVNSLSETGSAYIFTRSSGWQQGKLLANDTIAGDRFGLAVAVTEDGHVLAAAPPKLQSLLDVPVTLDFIFVRWPSWPEVRFYTAPPCSASAFLRWAQTGTLVSAAPAAAKNSSIPGRAKLTASDAVPFGRFGSAVAISGSYAPVSAFSDLSGLFGI
ncbi:unnamed protein product [Symbiodinium sp. CCMP2592]|nr:unnamed protein product [Symbiodinium sp. CCMP2592]